MANQKKSAKTIELDIVIPVYNEHDLIARTLDEIEQKIKTPYKVIIVYDFPEDTTLPVVRKYREENPGRNIQLLQNTRGKGALNAIRSGFDASNGLATLVSMADLSDDLSICDEMFAMVQRGFDIVCGSRYMRGGKHIGGPFLKKTMSRVAGLTLHYLAGIPTHDATNSFKMYRTQLLKDVTIESQGGFEVGMEIVIKSHLQGYRVSQLPTIWRDRSAGDSRFKLLEWLPSYLKWYFLAYSRYLPFKKVSKKKHAANVLS